MATDRRMRLSLWEMVLTSAVLVLMMEGARASISADDIKDFTYTTFNGKIDGLYGH